ncbi:DUF4384 domain-containing protein [Pseudohalocynthiibacter aestuariivivens]|uniref:DUF4384 domain-containing protein n=1 Tax=Roseovarius pelagicus TaxID=2980108 RepID=A0ABY6D8I8_9RHOB|nr:MULTISPECIES: DUF4384 domain-containing protein [Rhodobacterales]QIE45646.1 DUF4384 domain-containing protein [Pseudohalocynthiibacter aestuariivivens]UXX82436.1 DUF4384 domain-containing protein [Roseovarius pelagicus]
MFKTFKITATAALMSVASVAFADMGNLDSFRALSAVEVAETEMVAAIKPIAVADEASASKGVLTAGDRIAFELSGVEGAKIYILNMDSAGTIQMIYPNKYVEGGEAQTEDMMMVPAEGASYEFEVSGEGGSEVVKVIAIDGESSAFDALIASLFDTEKTFPRAIQPAEPTTDALTAFFESSDGAKIREATLEYVIAK